MVSPSPEPINSSLPPLLLQPKTYLSFRRHFQEMREQFYVLLRYKQMVDWILHWMEHNILCNKTVRSRFPGQPTRHQAGWQQSQLYVAHRGTARKQGRDLGTVISQQGNRGPGRCITNPGSIAQQCARAQPECGPGRHTRQIEQA